MQISTTIIALAVGLFNAASVEAQNGNPQCSINGAMTCGSSDSLLVCNHGYWIKLSECPLGTSCSGGRCVFESDVGNTSDVYTPTKSASSISSQTVSASSTLTSTANPSSTVKTSGSTSNSSKPSSSASSSSSHSGSSSSSMSSTSASSRSSGSLSHSGSTSIPNISTLDEQSSLDDDNDDESSDSTHSSANARKISAGYALSFAAVAIVAAYF